MDFEQKKSFGINKYIHNHSNTARGRCPPRWKLLLDAARAATAGQP